MALTGPSISPPTEHSKAIVERSLFESIDGNDSQNRETTLCTVENISMNQFTNVSGSSSREPCISETRTDTALAGFEPCNLSDSGSGVSESGYNSDRDNGVEDRLALSQTTFQFFLMNLQMRKNCPRRIHSFRRMQKMKRILLMALIVCMVLILIGGAIFIYFIKKDQTKVTEDDFPPLNSTPMNVLINPLHFLTFDKNEPKSENPALNNNLLDILKANLKEQSEAEKQNLTISDSLRNN